MTIAVYWDIKHQNKQTNKLTVSRLSSVRKFSYLPYLIKILGNNSSVDALLQKIKVFRLFVKSEARTAAFQNIVFVLYFILRIVSEL